MLLDEGKRLAFFVRRVIGHDSRQALDREGLAAIRRAGGRGALKTAELCLQVIGACVHECDLGAWSCDDRRIRP